MGMPTTRPFRTLPSLQLEIALVGLLNVGLALEDPFDNNGLDGVYIDEVRGGSNGGSNGARMRMADRRLGMQVACSSLLPSWPCEKMSTLTVPCQSTELRRCMK